MADPSDGAVPTRGWTRRAPFRATVATRRLMSRAGSSKSVWHVELDVTGSDLAFHPGDCVGVVPQNSPVLVDSVLESLGLDGREPVAGSERTLADVLTDEREISIPSARLLRIAEAERPGSVAELSRTAALSTRPAQTRLPRPDVLDLLTWLSPRRDPWELVATLRPITPRAFSVASSPLVDPARIGLTVAELRETAAHRDRFGVASSYLVGSQAAGHDAPARPGVFLIPNAQFRPPRDDAPVIMIAAGTGIAPFRGFLQHRSQLGGGPAWLVYGERTRDLDFCYEDEITAALKHGVLDRLTVALSQQGPQRRYVQDALREDAHEVAQWLTRGAHVYVCGHSAMTASVSAALEEILAEALQLGPVEAKDVTANLVADGRLVIDSYEP